MKLEDIKNNMVVVCRKAHRHERSINSWVAPMDNTIGKPMKVIFFDEKGAFCEPSEEWWDRWYYDIEWLEPWTEEWTEKRNDDNREAFMAIVYDELNSDPDNNRANRIIDAADEYVDNTIWSFVKRLMGKYDEVLSIGDIIEELDAMKKGEL